MGVFGVQLVLTMVTASFLHKIAPYYSLGRWLLTTGLQRYLSPDDKILRPHISAPASSNRASKKKASQRERILSSPNSTTAEIVAAINSSSRRINSLDQSLAVPKSANIQLVEAPLTWKDVDFLHFSGELEFLLNFTLATVAVVASTSLYYYLRPAAAATEYNLSVIWILVVMVYAFKLLFTLTRVYLSEELAHQRSICMVFTALLFVCALGVLLVDESILNFGLEKSHRDICNSLSSMLGGLLRGQSGKHIQLPMWTFKIGLAFLSSILSMTLVFPGFRFADTHFSTIRCTRTPLFKTCLHANYIAPMFCLSLWIQPLTQSVIAEKSSVNLFSLMVVRYDTFRVLVLLCVCALRFALFRTYLQSHLNTAKWKMENLRHEQGRITISNLRKKVSNVFLFYTALGIQYIAPYIILFAAALLFGISNTSNSLSKLRPEGGEGVGKNGIQQLGFGTGSFHGCIAFMCWWLCFSNAMTSGFGAVLKEFL